MLITSEIFGRAKNPGKKFPKLSQTPSEKLSILGISAIMDQTICYHAVMTSEVSLYQKETASRDKPYLKRRTISFASDKCCR